MARARRLANDWQAPTFTLFSEFRATLGARNLSCHRHIGVRAP